MTAIMTIVHINIIRNAIDKNITIYKLGRRGAEVTCGVEFRHSIRNESYGGKRGTGALTRFGHRRHTTCS